MCILHNIVFANCADATNSAAPRAGLLMQPEGFARGKIRPHPFRLGQHRCFPAQASPWGEAVACRATDEGKACGTHKPSVKAFFGKARRGRKASTSSAPLCGAPSPARGRLALPATLPPKHGFNKQARGARYFVPCPSGFVLTSHPHPRGKAGVRAMSNLVEMTGIEPVSEKKSMRVSPGAVCLQHSLRIRPTNRPVRW